MWGDKERGQVGYNEEMFEGDAPQAEPTPREDRATADEQAFARSLLQRQLAAGERLRWQGSPMKLHGPRGGMQKMFAAVFLGFACFWEVMALQALAVGPMGLFFPLFGIPFILVGLKLFFPGLGAGRRLRSTVYAVTDRRAIEVSRGRVTSWDLDALTSVEKYYYQDGTGDLVLSNDQVEHYRHNGHTHTRPVTLTFYGLADVDAAEAALRGR